MWDPGHTGVIKDGRQLFGSRTWWIFFRDGYEALSVLDDNRDGRLTGGELEGIAVWVERNGDGASQAGEVLTLEEARIESIGVRATTDADGTLMSAAGIRFFSGQPGMVSFIFTVSCPSRASIFSTIPSSTIDRFNSGS